ncbi:MAG: peptidoglycan DD-metalloendopeptidase family protein [Ruminococcus sp.]|nr:peptidoglycan DD-metalloendopeptidase family protein [Ruminococcus sp.]
MRLLKRAMAFAAAFIMSVGVFSGYAEDQESYSLPGDLDQAVSEDNTTDAGDNNEDPEGLPSAAFDVTPYADRLREIGEAQRELDEKIRQNEEDQEKQAELQQAVIAKLGTIQAKQNVINSYLTRLEISIKDNKTAIEDKQSEIDESIARFKRRLRALYIAGGEEGYLNVLLSSSDFYDVLMRMELVKRVAEHDDRFIDELNVSKQELEALRSQLSRQQSEYTRQMQELEAQQKEYQKLADEHREVAAQLAEEKKQYNEENEAYIAERRAFEDDLSDVLRSSFSDSADDADRQARELEAAAAIERLQAAIQEREDAGEEIPEDECRYNFMWPVPGVYYISYGVGARWGSYHQGIDISGDKYDDIRASESGRVIKINTSCPHDYGKSESCGCGGGYGNYIIIDHGNNFITLYGHLNRVDVEVGDYVKQGDHIGLMGSTGHSTGDHLHFEIRYNGLFMNPSAFVTIDKFDS